MLHLVGDFIEFTTVFIKVYN